MTRTTGNEALRLLQQKYINDASEITHATPMEGCDAGPKIQRGIAAMLEGRAIEIGLDLDNNNDARKLGWMLLGKVILCAGAAMATAAAVALGFAQ